MLSTSRPCSIPLCAGSSPEPPDAQRGQPGDPRDHFLQREEKEREHRKDARKDASAWAASRKQRANDERKDIAATWGSLTNNSEAKAELALHADRMSRLNRVIDLAEDRNEPTVTARAKALVEQEIARSRSATRAASSTTRGPRSTTPRRWTMRRAVPASRVEWSKRASGKEIVTVVAAPPGRYERRTPTG